MIKFIIITRHKPGLTRERFFYEWAFIHVSLMLHTASSMRRFKRYVQHYANPDIPDKFRALPHPKMDWESFAEHLIEDFETSGYSADYTEIMRPHSFSDTAMEVLFMQGHVVYQHDDFRSGGVKVIHRLANRNGQSIEDFRRLWRDEHVPMMTKALERHGLRKYEISLPYEFDVAAFKESRKGSLLAKADVNLAHGLEELWFDNIEDALRLGSDPTLREMFESSYGRFADVENSFSMIVNERVVFDFVTPGEISPMPAVLDPDSLDAVVFSTGKPYHEPRLD